MKRTAWFDRHFSTIEDNGLLPSVLERLAGTAARLSRKMERIEVDLPRAESGKWSIKKEIGHLADLEPLWLARAEQIAKGEPELAVADLQNRRTHEADHDEKTATELIAVFEIEREKLVARLRQATATELENSAMHPRLQKPQRLVDLAFFVAEHDDHHLAQIEFLAAAI